MWLGATAPGTAALAEQVRVSLDQAYSIGRTAVAQRNYPLAFAVATGLLDANPKDPRALTLMAASAPHVGQPKQGRLAARDAYRLSPTKARKREAALYAAVAAAKEERSLTAQLWLRRAYQNSETEQHRSSIGRQYRQYARAAPLKLSFAASVAPSSNLNGGAESQFLLIDGILPIGVLSGSAQALDGLRATVRGRLSYTLSESPTHKTTLGIAGSVSRVRLSSGARALAPNVENSDLGQTQISASLTHQIAHKGRLIPDTYSVALGQTWYGGSKLSTYGSLDLGRSFKLSDTTLLRAGVTQTFQSLELQQDDQQITSLRFNILHRLPSSDLLRAGLRVSKAHSDDDNDAYTALTATLGYERAAPIGPVTLSTSLSYTDTRYDSFAVGFISVPGGRQDQSTQARLGLALKDISYLGFVPQLDIDRTRTKSNISRFERRTSGVGLSFVSAF